MKFYSSEKKQRLTLSQAMVKFLQAQYSEYDGVEHRFFQGIWGIFGHGNVSGLSQALVEYAMIFLIISPLMSNQWCMRQPDLRARCGARRPWLAPPRLVQEPPI